MDKKTRLSTLWIFLTLNFIFCDVFSLHYQKDLQNLLNGKVGDTPITQPFLLLFSIIMEIPMLMILLSRLLQYRANRTLNLIVAMLLLILQLSTLFWGENTLHYKFFSLIEILTCMAIIGLSCQWRDEVAKPSEFTPII